MRRPAGTWRRSRVKSAVASAAMSAIVAALLGVALVPAGAGTIRGADDGPDPGAAGPYAVASLDYTLGDRAFGVPDFRVGSTDVQRERLPLADIELTGNVHYPIAASGPAPLVVLLHGYWATCADRVAADIVATHRADDPARTTAMKRLWQWPCAAGVQPLPSYRGFDYLAERLASQGMVVVSISANGVNAGELGDTADNARSMLVNRHLAMWGELTRTGRGELAGRFTDPQTHAAKAVDFAGRIDLNRVGTMGQGRGGRAMAWNAADAHRDALAPGVRIAGVFALGAAGVATALNDGSPDAPKYRVSSAPLAVWIGSCDTAQGQNYVDLATGSSTRPIYRWVIGGANHNFLNTQWSPSSGQATAVDDAADSPGPGICGRETVASSTWPEVVHKLTEDEERRVLTGYATAFFRRVLMGSAGSEPVISGERHPYASFTDVVAVRIDPDH